jgi:hypothetical protein
MLVPGRETRSLGQLPSCTFVLRQREIPRGEKPKSTKMWLCSIIIVPMALDSFSEEQKPFLSSQGLTDVTAAPLPQFLRRIFQEGTLKEDVGDS